MKAPLLGLSVAAFLIPLPWGIEFILAKALPTFQSTVFDGPFVMYRFFLGNSMGLVFYLCVAFAAVIVFSLITSRVSLATALVCVLLLSPLLCFSYYVVFLSHWT